MSRAESEYQKASEELRQAVLRSNVNGGSVQDVDVARQRKADARREYLRILRVFTDLVLRGRSPGKAE